VSDRFEDLSRRMAGTTSRRGVLKMFGAAAGAAAVASVIKPFQGGDRAYGKVSCTGATTASELPCGAGTTRCGSCCCKAGVACANATTSTCGCPAGTTKCGNACCQGGTACANAAKSTCAAAVAGCTGAGVACGTTCCASGQCCNSGTCGSCAPTSACTTNGNICQGTATACPTDLVNCVCVPRQGGGSFCMNGTGGGNAVFTSCSTDADCTTAGYPGYGCATADCGSGTVTLCAKPCATCANPPNC
jgi:hypothetical protein